MDSKIRDLADYFCQRSGSGAIVLLTDNPSVAEGYLAAVKPVYIVRTKKIKQPKANFEEVTLRGLNKHFLADKIFVCGDFLENKSPKGIASRRIRRIQKNAVFSVVYVKKGKRWNPQIFDSYFDSEFSALRGNGGSRNTNAGYSVAIGGKAANIYGAVFPSVSVLALIHQYNEADIIDHVIEHLLSQGVDVHVIDNWSNDGSYERVVKLAEKNSGRVSIERFPRRNTNEFNLGSILKRVNEVAYEKRDRYKWAMLNDADEMRYSPWPGVTLQKAFSFLDYLGYNAVDYTLFNFVPTKEGFNENIKPTSFFRYGEFVREPWAFSQIKSWKNSVRADLASTGSHHVQLPIAQLIYPLKFFLTHYPLRSTHHARKKIFQERKPRFTQDERKKGWNIQYDDITKETSIIRPAKSLVRFDGSFHKKYLIECVSGIGIGRNK